MKLLIIGGTRFLGRHLAQYALAQGHELTLFNRGRSNPDLFKNAEMILGDREHDLGRMAGRYWDAVIDTCGYFPRLVRLSAETLKDQVDRYVFISSVSVYADFQKPGIGEDYPVGKLDDESVESITEETYGPLKVLCEKAVQETYGERALVIRPGMIVGPHDPSDRFTYWPVRITRGGPVLAPERPEAPIQIIDVRDLVEFIFKLVGEHAHGVFNATGPDYDLTIGRLLGTAREVSGSDAELIWAPVEFLNENHVEPWSDMPTWVPEGEAAGFSRIDVRRAIRAGLHFRPLEETVRDTLDWALTRPEDYEWRAGLKSKRESDLLEQLKQ